MRPLLRFGLWAAPLAVLLVLVARPAAAGDEVTFLGLESVDLPRDQVDPLVEAVDDAIINIAVRSVPRQEALLRLAQDPTVSEFFIRAVSARANGAEALSKLQLVKAEKQLQLAVTSYDKCHGKWIDPNGVSELHVLRARVSYGKRDRQGIYQRFIASLPTHPTKELDAAEFPPEIITTFKKAVVDASSVPAAPPAPSELVTIGQRANVKYVVTGDVRRGERRRLMLLTIVDSTGALRSERVALPVLGDVSREVNATVASLLREAGVERKSPVAAVPEKALPTPTPTPKPVVVTNGGAKRWYRQPWYVWAGVAALATTGAVVAGVAANQNNGGGPVGPTPTPPPGGITIIVDGL